jgi:two-component system chemotaxis response regulator CheV
MNSGILVVRSGGRELGLPLDRVLEVGSVRQVNSVPGMAPAVRGVTEARGRLVPVAHLGALLAGEACPPMMEDTTQVLALVAEQWLALEVDAADAAPADAILPPPEGSGLASWVVGVVRRDKTWIPVLNLDALAERLRA